MVNYIRKQRPQEKGKTAIKMGVLWKDGRTVERWEDCGKREVRNTEEDDKWRKKAEDREKWEGTTTGTV